MIDIFIYTYDNHSDNWTIVDIWPSYLASGAKEKARKLFLNGHYAVKCVQNNKIIFELN